MRITRSERPVALFALLLAITLQAVIIYRYNHIFTDPGPSYWAVFLHHFSVSGYDPITYSVVTDWTAKYNVFRHPLLAFFVAPLYALNLALSALTGVNCVQYVVALFWIVATVYAFLFFYRIVLAILTGSDGSRFKVQSATRVQGSEGPSDGSNTFSTAPQAPLRSTRRGAFAAKRRKNCAQALLNCATGALLTAQPITATLMPGFPSLISLSSSGASLASIFPALLLWSRLTCGHGSRPLHPFDDDAPALAARQP